MKVIYKFVYKKITLELKLEEDLLRILCQPVVTLQPKFLRRDHALKSINESMNQ